MRSTRNYVWFLCAFALLVFQSCTEDEALNPDFNEDALAVTSRGNGGGGGNGGGNENGGAGLFPVSAFGVDVVQEWTELLLKVERYTGGMRPNATARALAYIYLTSYETAVPGMPEYQSTERFLDGLEIREDRVGRDVHWELALNAAFAKALDHFLINVPEAVDSQIPDLERTLRTQLSQGRTQRTIEASEEWGRYIADRVIAYSQTDTQGETQQYDPQPTAYEPPTGNGYWTYSADEERALFPYWGKVRTFVIDPDETSTVAPIPYSEDSNSDYYAEMMEVYEVNNAAREADAEQLWIAEFWSDDVEGLMFSPPARQYAIANQLIIQQDLSLPRTLELYLKLGFSLNDAAVSTWKYKYEYMVMRPSVYIHDLIDPNYQTNLYRLIYWPNPTFPGYPSGHSCFASAAAGVFIDYFGNNINFTDRSHEGRTEFRGSPRSFTSFRQLANENAYSRIPLGVHIRMDCTEGLRLGYEISDAINDLNLRRRPNI